MLPSLFLLKRRREHPPIRGEKQRRCEVCDGWEWEDEVLGSRRGPRQQERNPDQIPCVDKKNTPITKLNHEDHHEASAPFWCACCVVLLFLCETKALEKKRKKKENKKEREENPNGCESEQDQGPLAGCPVGIAEPIFRQLHQEEAKEGSVHDEPKLGRFGRQCVDRAISVS